MDFLVRHDDLHSARFAGGDEPPPLDPGQALLEVAVFGLTTNNITYAVFGDAMSYWDFFPAPDGWGRIPVWGFAEVAAPGDTGLEEGARVFGYLPPSTHLVVTPERVDPRGFVDASPHRASLPSAYNSYARVDADPIYDPAHEAEQMLLAPLYFTSFLLDDHLGEQELFGARTAVLSSASSKTASSAAFLLSRRDGVEVVGLTSPARVDFVEGLGVYDRVVPYEDVSSLPAEPAVYVDMSGDAGVRASVHGHYGDSLRHSAVIGATHREELAGDDREPLPGPRPEFFFAPDQLRKRASEWGREGLDRRMAEAWRPFVEWSSGWLRVERGAGPEALRDAYLELLDGRSDPAAGHVLSLR
jgi:hypothetical protein